MSTQIIELTRRTCQLFTYFLIFFSTVNIIVYMIFYIPGLFYPLSLTLEEGELFYATINAFSNKVYGDINKTFLPLTFPPFFLITTHVIFKVTQPSIIIGRVVTVTSLFIVALMMMLIVKEGISKNKLYYLLGFSLPFLPLFTKAYSLPFKSEMFGIAIGLVGLFMFLKRRYATSGIILAISILTKQILVTIPLALLLHLTIVERSKRGTLHFTLSLLVSLALILYAYSIYIRGNVLLHILVYYFACTLDFSRYSLYFPTYLALLIIYILCLMVVRKKEGITWLEIYGILTLLVTLYTIIRVDETINCFTQPYLATSLLLIKTLNQLSSIPNSIEGYRNAHINIQTTIVITLILLVIFSSFVAIQNLRPTVCPVFTEAMKEDLRALISLIRGCRGIVLSEDNMLSVLAGKEIIVNYFRLIQLYKLKLWDYKTLIEAMKEGKVSTVILTFNVKEGSYAPYLPPEVIETIREYYTLKDRILGYYVYYHI